MLQLIDVTKRYGEIVANDHISLTVNSSEIVGLVGENGAGKSTLLSIAGGFQKPDSGSIAIHGHRVNIDTPRSALRRGISVVHQHFALVPTFTVREQLALAGLKSHHIPDFLEDSISSGSRIENLALGQRQQVEIARALVCRPMVLLLDEPTSILAPREIGHLFEVLRQIREAGTSVVLVTHKIREALELADRILVLRKGQLSAEETRAAGQWREGARTRILSAMFDWDPDVPPGRGSSPARRAEATNVLLSVNHLSTMPSSGRQTLRDITFRLHIGQRMAVLGVDGQGQRELLESIAGYLPTEGTILLHGKRPNNSERNVRIGFLTDDRTGEGGAVSLDLSHNLLLKRQRLPRFSRMGLLRQREISRDASTIIQTWRIEPPQVRRPFGTLSGGNMQKLLLAREFARDPDLLVASNPVQGLDARTAAFLWAALKAFADRGRAVVFTTPDISDAEHHADVVSVLFNGRLSEPQPVASTSERELGEMMVSGW